MTERKRDTRSYSLRGQLGMLVAALAIPLLALQGWWSYHAYEGARESAEIDALAFADATALGVQQFFTTAEELMMANASQFGMDWLDAGDCQEQVARVTRLFPFLHNAVAVHADGTIECSYMEGSPAASTAAGWAWFEAVRVSRRFTLGPPVEGTFSGTWVMPVVAPVLGPDGEFHGALAGTVALTELSRLFGGVTLPESHLVTVATADRIVISRSHEAADRVGQPLPANTGTDREVAPGRWVATGPDLAGVPRTWGQVEIEPGWFIYVGVPDELVYGPALRASLGNMAATLLVVLLGILFATRSHRRIARALHELTAGTRATASGHIVPVPSGTPTEVREVVEQFNHTLRGRDRAEAAERKARERFQSIFDNAVFGLYVSTVDGRFLQVNPALVSMLGYESEEALLDAGPAALYAHPDRRTALVADALETGRAGPFELDWLRADGVPITVRVAGKVIPGPDGEPAFEMVVQDITDEKRTEDELRQTQKMEAIGQLAGGVAHDFNNLLTVIAGNVELLEDDLAVDDPLRADLTQIARATSRATSLTRRLLTFSRRDRRGEQVMDVNEVIPELGKMLVPLIGETVVLKTDLDPDSLLISIDPGELEQVVLNLVLNARDAMPRGGRVVIRTRRAPAADPQFPAEGPDAPTGVVLSVTDTGMGMHSKTRQRMFEPFYTTKPMGEGTGLGLSTVYGIVKRTGGTIAVDSEPGAGTRMTLWFPGATAAGPSTAAAVEAEAQPVAGSERVLVVEDDPLVRDFVRRALEEVGYSVSIAASGNEALELLGTDVRDVDLVLTDVVMPGLSGPELAERLTTLTPDTPVLFMSGYIDNSFINTHLRHHPGTLLRKPFTAAELRKRVRRSLDSPGVVPSPDPSPVADHT